MVDPYLQSLTESPINTAKRANKIWLPEGRKPAPKRDDGMDMGSRAEGLARRVAEQRKREERLNQLLDYYATTTVPVERIQQHTGLTKDEVTQGLADRGRAA